MRGLASLVCLALATALVSANHEAVKIGKFDSYEHGVHGEVYAVNETTLFVKDFEYDGEGPDAFFWTGTDGKPGEVGIILTHPFEGKFYEYTDNNAPILVGKFDKVNITLTLPKDLKVTDLKWLSVWCRQFNINFADIFFPADLSFEHDDESSAEPEGSDAEPEHEGDHDDQHYPEDNKPKHHNQDQGQDLPPPLLPPRNAHDPHNRHDEYDPDVEPQSESEPEQEPSAESESEYSGSSALWGCKLEVVFALIVSIVVFHQ